MARSDQFAATRRPMLGAVGRLSIKIPDLNRLRTYLYVLVRIRSIKILFLDLYVQWTYCTAYYTSTILNLVACTVLSCTSTPNLVKQLPELV
eukprot:SAG11_NODE_2454_length_3343_cov_13.121455_1_plen_92_part_00